VAERVWRRRPPDDAPSPEEALGALLKGRGDYNSADVAVGRFDAKQVSLPSDVSSAPMLVDLGDDVVQGLLADFGSKMLRCPAEARRLLDESGIVPYTDQRLVSSRVRYRQFLQELQGKGLLRWTRTPKEHVGVFFVKKKNGRLRMVIDARASNVHFVSPPGVDLATSDALGRIELVVGPGADVGADMGAVPAGQVHIGTTDIKDCFYRMRLPDGLCDYFCLPGVSAADAAAVVSRAGGDPAFFSGGEGEWWPSLTVLPMGFTWSLFLAQRVNTHLVGEIPSLKGSRPLVDRGPPLVLVPGDERVSHYVYVDNIGVVGVVHSTVAAALDECVLQLDSRGLTTHDTELHSNFGDVLGVELNSELKCTRLTAKRYWRLERGLGAALARRCLSGKDVEILVGHCTFAGLIFRQSLSIFHACYAYVQSAGEKKCVIWPSVRQELQSFKDILPLLESDWELPWNERVTATDSSGYGYGECVSDWGADEAARHGRLPERARFRRGAGSARAHSFAVVQEAGRDSAGRVILPDTDDADPHGWEEDDDFPEVPVVLMDHKRWRVTRSGRWKYSEDIHLTEARALVGALHRCCRTRAGCGQRRLFLADNMGDVLAFGRCRARRYPLLRQVRLWSGLCLARNIRPAVRWIPSERNVADAPSRLRTALVEWDEPEVEPANADAAWCDRMGRSAGAFAPTGVSRQCSRVCDGAREPVGVFSEPLRDEPVGRPIALAELLPAPCAQPTIAPLRLADLLAADGASGNDVAVAVRDSMGGPPVVPDTVPITGGISPNCPRQMQATRTGVGRKPVRGVRARAASGRHLLGLFAGTGGVASAAEDLGFAAKRWDVKYGDEYDLAQLGAQRRVLRSIRHGDVYGVMAAPPCGSSAQTGGARQAASQPDVPAGSTSLAFSVKVILECHRRRLPWVLVLPTSSPSWSGPGVQRLTRMADSEIVVADLCQFGSRWRRRTTFLTGRMDHGDLQGLGLRCHGHQGICSRTHRAHTQVDGPGRARLPARLCQKLASLLVQGERDDFMDRAQW